MLPGTLRCLEQFLDPIRPYRLNDVGTDGLQLHGHVPLRNHKNFVFRRSLHDPMKTAVVIFGIKTGIWFRGHVAAADDPAGTAVARARRRHGVFAVVATRLARQALLAVAEYHAVLRIRERAAGMD